MPVCGEISGTAPVLDPFIGQIASLPLSMIQLMFACRAHFAICVRAEPGKYGLFSITETPLFSNVRPACVARPDMIVAAFAAPG